MADVASTMTESGIGEAVELRLLGRFALLIQRTPIAVSRTGQRLLARVALSGGAESRSSLAGTLWPDHREARAQANLRGAVWRLPTAVRERMVLGATAVHFDAGWTVDAHRAETLAHKPAGEPAALAHATEIFRHDLLPEWDEPWLHVERERHRQLRLHALEDLARAHLDAGRPLDAVDCALIAIAAEPLRESAQSLLLRGHLAAGNRATALCEYERFRKMLDAELGVEPTAELQALVEGVARPGARREPSPSDR